jgi:hypothetical protein
MNSLQPVMRHVVSAAQQKEFEKKFAKFMYNTLTPLYRLGDPDLEAALAVLR